MISLGKGATCPAVGLFLKYSMCNAVTSGISVSSLQVLHLWFVMSKFILHCCQVTLPKIFPISFLFLIASGDLVIPGCLESHGQCLSLTQEALHPSPILLTHKSSQSHLASTPSAPLNSKQVYFVLQTFATPLCFPFSVLTITPKHHHSQDSIPSFSSIRSSGSQRQVAISTVTYDTPL